MPCYLLHIVEQQDPRPYDDPDVKDIVGTMPQFYCTRCQPLLKMSPGGAMKCIERDAPCWMGPDGPPCEQKPPTPDPWDPKRQL